MKSNRRFIIVFLASITFQIPVFSQQIKLEKLELDVLDEKVKDIVNSNAQVEVLIEGLRWTEGPLWVESEKMLLFSEIPSNTVYKWTQAKGMELYLNPSGYTESTAASTREPGSNGLLLDPKGNLVLCQHGDRQMGRMNSSLKSPKPNYVTLVNNYKKSRLNSPNDAIYHSNGDLYFTDPPYGLPSQNDTDPAKELDFNGVYVFKKDGKLNLLTDKLTRPNGIAIFPKSNKIIVSNSDPRSATWYVLNVDNLKQEPTIFYDATPSLDGSPGLPDGLKITKSNIVLASGPGGVWIFDANAKLLGKIRFKSPISNVALSEDEKYMYLTNTGRIVRVKLK